MKIMCSHRFLSASVCLAVVSQVCRSRLPCLDYGSNEDECLADPGNSDTSTRCVFDDGACKCGLQTPIDVVFLFDRNDNSLRKAFDAMEYFYIQREWMAATIEYLLPADSRVAIIDFANGVSTHMTLYDSASMNTTQRAARARELQYYVESPESVTGEAVSHSIALFTTEGRPQANKVLVLFTTQNPWCGGCDSDDPRITPCVYNAQLEDIAVITLAGHAMWEDLDSDGIKALQCLDDSNKDWFQEFNGFTDSTWTYQVKPTIVAGTCPANGLRDNKCNASSTDLVFVVDSSSSISEEDFSTQLEWIGSIIADSLPHDELRVAFVRFDSDSVILRNFSNTTQGPQYYYTFSQLISLNRGLTNTIEAMQDVIELFEEIDNEATRKRRVMVLLTDGHPNPENPSLCDTKTQLEALDVWSLVVVIGEDSIADKVECLSDELMVVSNFSQQSFEVLSKFITEQLCYTYMEAIDLFTTSTEVRCTTIVEPIVADECNDSQLWLFVAIAAIAMCLLMCCVSAYLCYRLKVERYERQSKERHSKESKGQREELEVVASHSAANITGVIVSEPRVAPVPMRVLERQPLVGGGKTSDKRQTNMVGTDQFDRGDFVADEKMDDEIMYIPMPETRNSEEKKDVGVLQSDYDAAAAGEPSLSFGIGQRHEGARRTTEGGGHCVFGRTEMVGTDVFHRDDFVPDEEIDDKIKLIRKPPPPPRPTARTKPKVRSERVAGTWLV